MCYMNLLSSIASTVADYRQGEIPAISATHVGRWISQFDAAVRMPMLIELDHILRQTYCSKNELLRWMLGLVSTSELVLPFPSAFWSHVTILRLQSGGSSQQEMSELLNQTVTSTFNLLTGAAADPSGPFMYLDDFIFSGNTIITDLSGWITCEAPPVFHLHIVVVGSHAGGEHYVRTKLESTAHAAQKTMTLKFWRSLIFEDRKSCIASSEVFRPTRANGDPNVDAYVADLQARNYPPVLRPPGAMPSSGIFSSAATRDVLEWELLRAGTMLRAGCSAPKQVMRPLGYSKLATLGFGATAISFRNCPNNAPLALWWGDASATSGPLRWYPLFPRRQPASALGWAVGAPAALRGNNAAVPSSDEESEDEEEPDPIWEEDAIAAVQRAIESFEFDAESGVIRAATDEGSLVIEDVQGLRNYLEEAYQAGWYSSVPIEGGEAVFEGDPTDAVEDALADIASELDSLGWEY